MQFHEGAHIPIVIGGIVRWVSRGRRRSVAGARARGGCTMGIRAIHGEVVEVEILLRVRCRVTGQRNRVLVRIKALSEELYNTSQ